MMSSQIQFNPSLMIVKISQRLPARNLTSQITLINHFPVAHGGDADVYKGLIRDTLPVGLKVYRGISDPQKAFKHLQKEVSVLNRIPVHPNIAEIYGVGVMCPDRPTLVLRWYENGSASNYLNRKDFNTKLAVIRGITRGIQHLHSYGIIHGDLKGTNVLIKDDGCPVLADFALSQILDHSTGFTTSSPAASVHWLAPEIFVAFEYNEQLFQGCRSFAADIWALGSTVYELLTGKLPYADLRGRPQAISRRVCAGKKPLLDTDYIIHSHLAIRELLLECWSKDPYARPTINEFIGRFP
ncbi:kinase-like domain-containing protein [Mycena floridula]|nr:kinase-like domain-containing protein [Mycena floridula]